MKNQNNMSITDLKKLVKEYDVKTLDKNQYDAFAENFSSLIKFRNELQRRYQQRQLNRLSKLSIDQINSLLDLICEDTGEYSAKYLAYYLISGNGWLSKSSDAKFKEHLVRGYSYFKGRNKWFKSLEEFNARVQHILNNPSSY